MQPSANPDPSGLRITTGDVWAVAPAPDGTRIIDDKLQVWDLASGAAIMTLDTHEDTRLPYDTMTAISVTPDGARAITVSNRDDLELDMGGPEHPTYALSLWDLTTGARIAADTGQGWVTAAAITPDGSGAVLARYLVENSAGEVVSLRVLEVWEPAAGVTTLSGPASLIADVAVSPDGTRAVTGCGEGVLLLWDLRAGAAIRVVGSHGEQVTAVAIFRDGTDAVSASGDGTLRFWKLDIDGTSHHRVECDAGRLQAVAVTPDHARAVTIGEQGDIVVARLVIGGPGLTRWTPEVPPQGGCAAMPNDSSRVIYRNANGELHVLDIGPLGPVTAAQ